MVDVAKLRGIVEVQGAAQAEQELRGVGRAFDDVARQSGHSAGGFRAFNDRVLEVQARARGARSGISDLGTAVHHSSNQARDASGKFTSLNKGLDDTGAASGRATGSLRGLMGPLGALSPVALTGAGAVLGLAAGFKTSAGASIEWESVLAGVNKTVDGTEAEIAALGDSIRTMAQDIPIGAVELAGLAESAGALGIAKENILEFTEVTALIGTTTDVSAGEAATALGQLSNVLSLTADDYERFGSTLVDLGNKGASTESAILGVTERAGAGAELIGFATEETLAWSASIANLGIEAEAGGSALQRFFLGAAEHVAAAGAELETMAETAGMSSAAFQQAFGQDASGALQTFISGLGELDQAAQLAVLSALGFNDVRITRALLGLAGNTDNLTNSLATAEQAWRDNTAMAEEAEKRFETTASQIEIARNKLNDAAITLGDTFTPALADAVERLADFTAALADTLDGAEFTNVVDQWDADLDRIGEFPNRFPDPPEEKGRRWGHFFSELAGYDWGDLWNDMFPDEDRFADFAGVSLPEVTDEQIAKLQNLVDLYENTPARVRTVTEAEYEHAKAMLEQIEIYGILTSATDDERRALEELIARGRELIAEFFSGDEVRDRAAEIKFLEENTWDYAEAEEGMVDAMIAARDAQREATKDGHRHNQMLREAAGEYDAAAVSAATLQRTIDDLHAVNVAMNLRIEESANAISHWEDRSDGVTRAIEYLDDALEDGRISVDEHAEKVGKLTDFNDRLQAGIQDDLIPAYVDEQLAAADLQVALDELDRKVQDNEISQEDAAKQAAALRDEFEKQQNPVATLIDKIGELIDTLIGLDAQDPEITITADTTPAYAAVQGFKDFLANNPATIDLYVNQNNAIGFTTRASGGPLDAGQLALVGEEGPELIVTNAPAHVIPNDETMRLLSLADSFAGGFAEGTGSGSSRGGGGGDPYGVGVALGMAVGEGVSAGLTQGIAAIPPEALFGDEDTIIAYVEGVWGSAVQAVERLFVNDPIEIFSGDAGAALQKEIEAYEAFLAALLEAGFSADSPEYQEAYARYVELLRELELITAVIGTDSAEAFWEAWEAVNGEHAASAQRDKGLAEAMEAMARDGLLALEDVLGEYPDVVDDVLDDVLDAVAAGTISYDEAMQILAAAGDEHLIPALERLESALAVDLAEAILKYGPDSPEVQAILAGLGLIEDALSDVEEQAGLTSDEIANIVDPSQPSDPFLTDPTGDTAGTAAPSGGSGGTAGLTALGAPGMALHEMVAGLRYTMPGTTDWDAWQAKGAVISIDGDGLTYPEAGYELWKSGENIYVNPFADGGIVTEPTLALIGEAGTEGVFPLDRAADFGFGMDADQMDELADKIARAIVRHAGRNDRPVELDGRVLARNTFDAMGRSALTGQAVGR